MNNGWLSSRKRKRHQRALNALVRLWNKVIEDDTLWRGRFVVRQVRTKFELYEDGSGGMLYALLEFRDKKTGQTKQYWDDLNSLRMFGRIGWEMNSFIVDDCKVWEREDLRKDTTDYRLVP